MNTKIVEKIIKDIVPQDCTEECLVKFSDSRYKSYPITRDNFKKIEALSNNKRVAFIDGGNAEIIASPELSVSLVRVYCTIYQNNKRISSEIHEFYAVAKSFLQDDEIHYGAEIYNIKGTLRIDDALLTFNSYDSTIKQGIFRAKLRVIGGIARRFAELQLAIKIAEQLGEGDLIVRDGTLQSSVTNESKLLDELYSKALAKGIVVSGLAKTSNLYMDNGNAASSYFIRLAPLGKWHYHPVAEISHPDHQAELYFVKLNERSNHVFRFEVYKKSNYEIETLLALLSQNATDPVFLGYPYGLVEADQFARVSKADVEYARAMFMAKAGKDWARIKDSMSASDAHDVLDNIK